MPKKQTAKPKRTKAEQAEIAKLERQRDEAFISMQVTALDIADALLESAPIQSVADVPHETIRSYALLRDTFGMAASQLDLLGVK